MNPCCRLFAFVAFAIAALLGGAVSLDAQAAVVKRNVNLRAGPSTSTLIIELLLPGDELTILDPVERDNYYNVRAADGEEGWVWSPNIRVFPPDSAVTLAVPSPPEVYRTCPLEGDAVQAFRQAANRLKNRNIAPTPAQIDPAVTLAALAVPGDDENRWQPTQGASVVGYVIDVKAGGKETVNCGEDIAVYRDTHIELVLQSNQTAKKRRVIVEVTPKWREFMSSQAIDWSTPTLKNTLEGRWVRFTGWLFFDIEHDDEAENTTPGRAENWRATAWEIHPVTTIQVCTAGPTNCH
jgi:hypothetical protein